MKNILPDLQERLDDATGRREAVVEQMKAIDTEVEAITRLVAIEERRHVPDTPPVQVHLSRSVPSPEPAIFIETALKDGPLPKNEIRDRCIEGGALDAGLAGRSLHFTLVNMMRGKRVIKLPDGRYSLPGGDAAPGLDVPARG